MKVIIDQSDPIGRAAESVTVVLEQHKGQPILVLVSGGSAFALLEQLPESIFSSDLTVAMLDERASADPKINNCAQLMTTGFYERAVTADVTFIDLRLQRNESAAALAARYEDALRTWSLSHLGGVIVATLCMGPDGHTAGIFPGFVATLDAGGKWVEAYTLPEGVNPHRERVTVTPLFFTTKIDHAVAYVVGQDKRVVLTTLISNLDTNPEVMPAALWHQLPDVTVITDS